MRLNKIIRNILVFVVIGFFLLIMNNAVVMAEDYAVQGKLYFDDGDLQEVSINDIRVWSYKIGENVKYEAKINKDGRGQVSFEIPITGVYKNDQLMILAEVNREDGLFGGISMVITEDNIQSGSLGNQVIHLNYIPVPEFDSTDDEQIKICWKGMDDFSVVSYEVLRSNQKAGEYSSVGRAGQTPGRQICFIDKDAKSGEKYYYRLSTLSSWNAGDGSEFMMSKASSSGSDGIMLVKGVVDTNKEILTNENDLTLASIIQTNNKLNQSSIDKWLSRIQFEIESRGWSYQVVLLVGIGIVLLVVVLFFIFSVEMANIRSNGSNVWQRKKSMSYLKKVASDGNKKVNK